MQERINTEQIIKASNQGPAVQMINMLIADAVRVNASDIHIEPGKNSVEVRIRVDGVLHPIRTMNKEMQETCISRIKIMAELDINERRLPQDGRISLTMDGRLLDFRVSTLPVLYGEKVVLRILDRRVAIRGLGELDFSAENLQTFQELIKSPFGLIVVTGPTGSGKTTTLYSALGVLRNKSTNIMTCEDPVEYDLEGVNQSPVFEKVGLTFARQLRAILRQDPDIILVGEMRDTETAETAFRAAMTGHLVLSTLHANDAPTTVTRLLDMGVPPFLVASGLSGIVAQRLCRRLCTRCRVQAPATPAQAALLGLQDGEPIWEPQGCPACNKTGYSGRVAVHEVFRLGQDYARLIMQQAPAAVLRDSAMASGLMPIREDALRKIRAGLTSTEEVIRHVHVRED